jgi:hypothetical protein
MAFQKADIGCRPEAQYTYDDGGFLRAFATVPKIAHSPGFRGRRSASEGEGRSRLAFLLIHDV